MPSLAVFEEEERDCWRVEGVKGREVWRDVKGDIDDDEDDDDDDDDESIDTSVSSSPPSIASPLRREKEEVFSAIKGLGEHVMSIRDIIEKSEEEQDGVGEGGVDGRN